MLGLREQVHRDPVGVGLAVADDQDLRRAGDHVDADGAEHQPLGGGDVDVARADDLVDRGHGLGAVGERRDRLRAADREHAVHAGDVGRREHQLVERAARRRHDHDQLGHAGDDRRDRVHQHRRRIRRLAAGHVQPDAVERADLLAEHGAVGLGVAPAFELLPLGVGADARGRLLERVARGRVDRCVRLRKPRQRHFEFADAVGLDLVEARGQLEQRRVAARAHRGEDLVDAREHVGRRVRLPREQRVEFAVEPGVAAVESPDPHVSPPPPLRRARPAR